MKKLMIVAAAAALTGVAEAAIPTTGEQVYNMTLSVKTTTAKKSSKIADALLGCETEAIAYRKQTTQKLAGLIWGCWCETINNPTKLGEVEYAGYVFWNVTGKYQYDDLDTTAFDWTTGWDWTTQIDRINYNGKKCEGIWALKLAYLDKDDATQEEYILTGAGFGTAAIVKGVPFDPQEDPNSPVYVSSMNGYFVGTRSYTCKETIGGHCGEEDKENQGVASWPLCSCGDPAAKTVAYGSWKIKFNATAAAKFAKTGDIQLSYKFPKYVTEFGEEAGEVGN